MGTKKKTVNVRVCDCCGVELGEHNHGEFNLTMRYNNPSYGEPGESVIGFESSPKGDYCTTCVMGFYNAFINAMNEYGFVDRYGRVDMVVKEEVKWVQKWIK